jgi:hypothetical protein
MKTAALSALALMCAPALLTPNSSAASLVANPSFEVDYNETWPHYGPLSEWTHGGGTGTNRSGGPFHNAGTPIPDGTQVALQQGNGQISQTISGLTPGQTYWIQFLYDVRACCGSFAMDLAVKWDDEVLDRVTGIEPVTGGNPYRFRNVPFTAAADTGVLAFATTATGDATFLIDAVTIVPGDPGRVVVANPSFEASGTPEAPGYLTAGTGAGWTGGGAGGVAINEAGGPFADNGSVPDQDRVACLQGPGFIEQTVRGLVAGETYAIAFRYNARSGNTPGLRLAVDGATRFEQAVTPVGGTAAYRSASANFVAAATTAVIRFEQTDPGDQTLLLDDIRVSGVVVEPIPNLKVSPPRLELGPGQQALAAFTVSGRRLESTASSVILRIANASVARLVDADANGLVTLTFPQGQPTTTLTTAIEGVGRGAATVEIVDNGGHDGVDGSILINGVTSLVVNPSFEATGTGPGVGYSPILAWSGGGGINNNAQPFMDNGLIPDREQVAFIQGSSTLSQSISGLTPGQRYAFQMFYNVRNCCGGTMDMAVRLDGTELAAVPEIAAVGAGAPFHFLNIAFTAGGPDATLEIATTATGDATLLLDGLCIIPQAANEIVVKNPSFEASGVPFGVGYQNAIAGWAPGGGKGINIDTVGPFADNGVAGAQDRIAFIQGPASLSQIIEGLTPGASYSLEYLVNARNGDSPGGTPYKVLIDGTEVLNTIQEPVGPGTPYATVSIPFTAAGESAELRFEGLATGTAEDDQSLLLDHIRITPASGGGPTVSLTITPVAGNAVNIAWPVTAPAGLVLHASTSLLPGSWRPVTTVPFVDGGNNNVLEVIDGPAKFYRLARP